MADYTTYFNGEWIPFSQVKIDPMDRGFLVGDVVFDVARTFNGKSFRMQAHIDPEKPGDFHIVFDIGRILLSVDAIVFKSNDGILILSQCYHVGFEGMVNRIDP